MSGGICLPIILGYEALLCFNVTNSKIKTKSQSILFFMQESKIYLSEQLYDNKQNTGKVQFLFQFCLKYFSIIDKDKLHRTVSLY